MKTQNNRIPHLTLNFLYKISQKLPKNISIRKSQEFLELAKKHQVRLGKTKRTMCSNCHIILIPKVNCKISMDKKENGFGMNIQCNNCGNSKFIIKKLK